MKPLLTLGLLGALGSAASALPNVTETIPAKGGSIRVTPIYNTSMQIEWRDVIFQINPSSAGDYTNAKTPNIILITDSQSSHWDEKAVLNLLKPKANEYPADCEIYAPKQVAAQLKPIELEQDFTVRVGFLYSNISSWYMDEEEALYSIDVVPGSDRVPVSRAKGQLPYEENGQGYILTLGRKKIYIAGNSKIPTNSDLLKNVDIAFLPVDSTENSNPQKFAKSTRAFKPRTVYPYGYRYPFDKTNDNPQQFAKALEGSGIKVKLRGWYDHPARVAKK